LTALHESATLINDWFSTIPEFGDWVQLSVGLVQTDATFEIDVSGGTDESRVAEASSLGVTDILSQNGQFRFVLSWWWQRFRFRFQFSRSRSPSCRELLLARVRPQVDFWERQP
jgi:hypothetical protein